ncbi:acyltransferase family protein [Rhizobium leguminosarum]
MVKSEAGSPYIYGVDALRFVCALMVTMFHLGFASWASPLYLRPYKMPLMENIAQPGWVGVELFFVISGLVIVNSAAAATAMSFLKGRILRLYPAVWICASLTLIVIATQDVNRRIIKNYLRSITLYPGGPWIDGQYWTLACEICFYALVFIICAMGQKARMPALALGLSLASTVFIALLYALPDSDILAIFTETA